MTKDYSPHIVSTRHRYPSPVMRSWTACCSSSSRQSMTTWNDSPTPTSAGGFVRGHFAPASPSRASPSWEISSGVKPISTRSSPTSSARPVRAGTSHSLSSLERLSPTASCAFCLAVSPARRTATRVFAVGVHDLHLLDPRPPGGRQDAVAGEDHAFLVDHDRPRRADLLEQVRDHVDVPVRVPAGVLRVGLEVEAVQFCYRVGHCWRWVACHSSLSACVPVTCPGLTRGTQEAGQGCRGQRGLRAASETLRHSSL